jgi:hypothetical protein
VIKNINFRKLIIVSLVASCFAGCSNNVYSVSYSSINSQYSQQLDQVSLGMTKQDLRKILPDLVVRGQTSIEGHSIEALELQHNYWAGVGGRLVSDRLWFYFQNNKLVKWGQPNDWPTKPDLIVENRFR